MNKSRMMVRYEWLYHFRCPWISGATKATDREWDIYENPHESRLYYHFSKRWSWTWVHYRKPNRR